MFFVLSVGLWDAKINWGCIECAWLRVCQRCRAVDVGCPRDGAGGLPTMFNISLFNISLHSSDEEHGTGHSMYPWACSLCEDLKTILVFKKIRLFGPEGPVTSGLSVFFHKNRAGPSNACSSTAQGRRKPTKSQPSPRACTLEELHCLSPSAIRIETHDGWAPAVRAAAGPVDWNPAAPAPGHGVVQHAVRTRSSYSSTIKQCSCGPTPPDMVSVFDVCLFFACLLVCLFVYLFI
jgi:hypothetical protein